MLSWTANLPILKTVTSFTEKSPIISKRIIINKCKITTTDFRKHFYQGLVPRNSPIVIDMLNNKKTTSMSHTVSNNTISRRTCSWFLYTAVRAQVIDRHKWSLWREVMILNSVSRDLDGNFWKSLQCREEGNHGN